MNNLRAEKAISQVIMIMVNLHKNSKEIILKTKKHHFPGKIFLSPMCNMLQLDQIRYLQKNRVRTTEIDPLLRIWMIHCRLQIHLNRSHLRYNITLKASYNSLINSISLKDKAGEHSVRNDTFNVTSNAVNIKHDTSIAPDRGDRQHYHEKKGE